MSQSIDTNTTKSRRRLPSTVLLIALLLPACVGLAMSKAIAEEAHLVPPPTLDEAPAAVTPGPLASGPPASEVATFAGGCFWGVQGVFQHVEGVTDAVSGYAGGAKATAQYEIVSTGTTGHAETVQVTYDPRQVSYGRLLQIYFSVAHDPTELNRQGPDVGTQYRSVIFPANADQAHIAQAYIAQLGQTQAFHSAIVTQIEPNRTFYPAEGYHQNFLTRNPTYPYIAVYDLPKIAALKRLFPGSYRADPVLVATTEAAK